MPLYNEICLFVRALRATHSGRVKSLWKASDYRDHTAMQPRLQLKLGVSTSRALANPLFSIWDSWCGRSMVHVYTIAAGVGSADQCKFRR